MQISFTKILQLSILLFFLNSCASIDKGAMKISNSVSSIDPVTGQREINLESEQNEVERASKQAQEYLEQVKESGIKIDNELKEYQRVTKVFNRLKTVVHRQHLPWEVHLIDNKSWNAFTIGGAKIFIFSGIFHGKNAIRSDDELAAVLAHEMAHVAARHSSEGRSKVTIAELTDKKIRTNKDIFEASFTTNQENEADKISSIYMALAGFNPSSAVSIWERMDANEGSYTTNLLYDHPLNAERAKNMKHYANLAKKYYTKGLINPNHSKILKNNDIFSYNSLSNSTDLKVGEGAGTLALLETVVSTYIEIVNAKAEQKKREKLQREHIARLSKQLIFKKLEIDYAEGGGKGIFGYATNATNLPIINAIVTIRYWQGRKLIGEENIEWGKMAPHTTEKFGIGLKNIPFTNITITPVYIQFQKSRD